MRLLGVAHPDRKIEDGGERVKRSAQAEVAQGGSVHARAAAKVEPPVKAEAVQMVLETGKPIAEVERDLGDCPGFG